VRRRGPAAHRYAYAEIASGRIAYQPLHTAASPPLLRAPLKPIENEFLLLGAVDDAMRLV
jgi:hypothetical protein